MVQILEKINPLLDFVRVSIQYSVSLIQICIVENLGRQTYCDLYIYILIYTGKISRPKMSILLTKEENMFLIGYRAKKRIYADFIHTA